MRHNVSARKERGGCLTTVLVLLTLAVIYEVYSLFWGPIHQSADYSFGRLALLVIILLLSSIGLAGLWTWKKWGMNFFLAALIIGLVVNVIAGTPIWLAFGVAGVIVLFWFLLLWSRWKYFT